MFGIDVTIFYTLGSMWINKELEESNYLMKLIKHNF